MEDISAAVIHDVKNLLGELALRLEARGDAAQETAIALNAAQRLTALLLVQRQEAGLLAANIDSASPADLLNELAGEYRSLFPSIEITADATQAPPFWFYDEALVRLALANAVHNACRYARAVVKLVACKDGAQMVFEVADDGPGFPEEMLQVASAAPAPASRSGTGLGLYLARKIAQLHTLNGQGGSVALANRNGGVFQLRLP